MKDGLKYRVGALYGRMRLIGTARGTQYSLPSPLAPERVCSFVRTLSAIAKIASSPLDELKAMVNGAVAPAKVRMAPSSAYPDIGGASGQGNRRRAIQLETRRTDFWLQCASLGI